MINGSESLRSDVISLVKLPRSALPLPAEIRRVPPFAKAAYLVG
jgi:hypothetical protein